MRKSTVCILAASLALAGFTACNKQPSVTASSDSDFSFEFTEVTTETSAVVTTTEEPAEPFKGYRMINVYLNGNLVSVQDYDENGNMVRDKHLGDEGFTYNYVFDESGNLIRETKLNVDGTIESQHVYEYDESGRMTKKTFVVTEGVSGNSHVYGYDASGFLVLDTEYNSDGTVSQTIGYENDAYGNPVKQTQRDTNGEMFEIKNEYEYDSYGNISKWTVYRGGELNGWTETVYDNKGHITSEKVFLPDGTIKSWIEYEYNENSEMTVQTIYKEDGTIFQIIMYGYDSNGLAIETKFDSNGDIVEMYQYVYTY